MPATRLGAPLPAPAGSPPLKSKPARRAFPIERFGNSYRAASGALCGVAYRGRLVADPCRPAVEVLDDELAQGSVRAAGRGAYGRNLSLTGRPRPSHRDRALKGNQP